MKYAILIGLTNVNPEFYDGWDGTLLGPMNDVNAMSKMINAIHTKIIINEDATVENVAEQILDIADTARRGDSVYIYFSGHGSRVPDRNRDEIDGHDETWCLFDGMLVDDDIEKILLHFETGVNVFFISDSCHSGTITKAAETFSVENRKKKFLPTIRPFVNRVKNINYKLDHKPRILTLSACQDFQFAYDGQPNSLFTEIMLNVFEVFPQYRESWIDFLTQVRNQMPKSQTPRLGYKNGRNIMNTKVFG